MEFVETFRSAFDRWFALRELRSLDREASQGAYWQFKNAMEEALSAVEMSHHRLASDIWDQAYARFPDEAVTSPLALALLLKLRSYDVAETLLVRGQKRYPRDGYYLEGLARIAFDRGNYAQALALSENLCRKQPGRPGGYNIRASSLSMLGRSREADAILLAGLNAAPGDLYLWLEYSRGASRRGDWPEALRRWTNFFEKFRHVLAAIGIASALKELGRYEEADATIAAVAHQYGTEVQLWLESAEIAERRKDGDEALRRWAAVRKRFPTLAVGYLREGETFCKLGQEQAAEQVLLEGIANAHDDFSPLIEYAWIAHRRCDWGEASKRWGAVREKCPSNRDAYMRGAEALDALGRIEEAAKLRFEYLT